MLKYLLGTDSGIQGDELGASDEVKPEEVEWQTAAIEGKLDLLVTLDFACPVPVSSPILSCRPPPV